MNSIRTTVSFPEDLHQQLMVESVMVKKTLSQIIVEKLRGSHYQPGRTASIQARIRKGRALFTRIARMGNGIDSVRAVRDERDRNNG